MSKDTYSTILTETKQVVKQMLGLRRRIIKVREKVGKEKDKLEIKKIRKGMELD